MAKLSLMALVLPFVAANAIYDGSGDSSVGDGAPVSALAFNFEASGPQPNYCTNRSTDWECYNNGKPKCCSKTKGSCPNGHEPPCECNGPCYDTKARGSSICTYSPDYDCYENGWPKCCDQGDGESCPPFPTICDTYDSNYCGMKPDYDCYRDGVPSCCEYNMYTCPKTTPGCGKEDGEWFEIAMKNLRG